MRFLKHYPVLLLRLFRQQLADVTVPLNPSILCNWAVANDVGASFIVRLAVSACLEVLVLSTPG